MSKLKNKFLYAAVIILTFTYILSFCNANRDKREKMQTALINPNYKEKITFFEFYDGDNQKIFLIKNNNFWEIQKKYGNFIQKMPANSQKINEFLDAAVKIVNMYKISDTYEEDNSFMILIPGFIQLKYGFENNCYEVFFGGNDFSLSSRYFMTGKSTSIYEISDYLDKFLTVSVQFWAEPLLISSEIFGKINVQDIQRSYAKMNDKILTITDLQKLLDLRHGGFYEISVDENAENQNLNETTKLKSKAELSELFLELGNKNTIKLEFFQEKEDSQIKVKSYYSTSDKKEFIFNSKISLWTYNKIKEIIL